MKLWFIRVCHPAAMFIRKVESKVSPANQHFRCSSLPRRNGCAHARSNVKRVLIHLIRARQSLDNLYRETLDVACLMHFADNHRELIPAQAAANLIAGTGMA